MPTGYADPVRRGEITTLRDFALSCARAFGACITMRDEPADAPIPEEFQPSTRFYDEKEAAAEARLAELMGLTMADAEARALADYTEQVARWHERRARRAADRERYEAMLTQVEAWTPPGPDHVEFKAFMLQQLRQSIDFDCSDKYDAAPERKSGPDWLADARTTATRDLERARRNRAEEINRVAGRNRWLRDLRDALPRATR